MARLTCLVLFSCLLHASLQRSTPQDSEYVAAVVEYQVSRDVEQNRLNYIQHIEEAARQNADIVVFPELTLTNSSVSFPVPIYGLLQNYSIPALRPDLYDNLLVSMSAAARNNSIYVVVNIRELLDCTRNDTGEQCPESKQYVFNTNVVLDRTGAVIDRYRKINLFGEASHTPALQPDLGRFTTDFGVTFTHFICFDLMFQVPAVQSVQKLNLTDVIFTTMWFSELPYLTAVEIQQAYAYTMNVNFIAAGANNVAVGSAGSGIYSGKAGSLVSIMPGVATTRVLVSRVPKIPGQVSGTYPGPIYDNPANHDGLRLITDPSLVSHVSRPLTTGTQEFVLVDKDVRCRFNVRLSLASGESFPHYRAVAQDGTNTYSRRQIGVAGCSIVACKTRDFKSCGYVYRAAAFDGIRSFSGRATGGARVCAVVACTGDSISTCGMRFSTYVVNRTAVFEELRIEATMPTPVMDTNLTADGFVVYPVSSKVSIMPLQPTDFTYNSTVVNSTTVHTYVLTNFNHELYSFALWGRRFATDGQEATPPIGDSANVHFLSGILLIPLLLRSLDLF